MMMKRGMVDKQGESMFASYRYLGVSNPGLQTIGSNECEVSICLATGEFLHSIILRPKKLLGSWNLVNPFLSKNEAWMDECAARLQPLVDQYKPKQHQNFAIIRRSDHNNSIMSWGQQNLFF